MSCRKVKIGTTIELDVDVEAEVSFGDPHEVDVVAVYVTGKDSMGNPVRIDISQLAISENFQGALLSRAHEDDLSRRIEEAELRYDEERGR